MHKERYRVLSFAGPWIAGMRNPGVGEIIELTHEQADYEVKRGLIEKADQGDPVPVTQLPPFDPQTVKKGRRK